MSTSFKINTVAIFDPQRLTWQQIETFCNDGIGGKTQSLMRSAILEFPAMSASDYTSWVSKCDNNTAYDVYLPERLDGAFATDPEAVSGGPIINGYTQLYATKYALHFLGSDYSFISRAYNTRILIYTYFEQHLVSAG